MDLAFCSSSIICTMIDHFGKAQVSCVWVMPQPIHTKSGTAGMIGMMYNAYHMYHANLQNDMHTNM